MPYLLMDIERLTMMWAVKLGRVARFHQTKKVKRHAQEAIDTIERIPLEVRARRFFKRGPFHSNRWEVQEFARWRDTTLSHSLTPRVIDRITRPVM